MSGTLFVSTAPGEIRMALCEAGEAVELWLEREDRASLMGAVFAGRVQQIVPALPGAFIELGLDRPGFLPGSRIPPEGSRVLVQVTRDRFADKPVELSTALSLPGRLLLCQPGRPGIRFSRKIAAERREVLAGSVAPWLLPGEGLVLRSRAAIETAAAIEAEIRTFRARHDEMIAAAVSGPIRRLDPVPHPVIALLDSLEEPLDRIVTDDRQTFGALRRDPAVDCIVELDPEPGFDTRHRLGDAFEEALDRVIDLPGGGRLAIETMTAFTAIDVDLGGEAAGRGRAADILRRVNLAAAREIPRQLRLRALGGAVIVDFISMESRAARAGIESELAAGVAADPVPVQLHGWTRLGHVELTRRRSRTPLADLMLEATGVRRKSSETVALMMLRRLVQASFEPGALRVRLHPRVVAELQGRLSRHLAAASERAGRTVDLLADPLIDPETFDIGSEKA